MKDCISYDTIQVLRIMSKDDSSFDIMKKHFVDWISLNYVCPVCAEHIRNRKFYENITKGIITAEKY